MNVRDIFNAAAADYNAARPRIIPCFEEFYGIVLELIPFESNSKFSVLDLGAGTGLLSALIHEAFPAAHITLSDVAPAMLEVAQQRFAGESGFDFRVEDYIAAPLNGRFDIVVSGLSLHHTPHDQLPGVFSKIFEVLQPGGFFINADQTLGVNVGNEDKIAQMWEKGCRERGATEAEIAGALERMRADLTAPLETQLEWMRGAGFAEVECWYKNWRFAVYSGRRLAK
ncbi:class I SAM-dependent methyltransferase [bacterium]|nr:MAG: class I SAM-dependent methyltransferase [bacterium]